MSAWGRLLLVSVLFGCAAVQAQVVKCTDSRTGKVTYSDSGCSGGEVGKQVQARKTAQELEDERAQAEAARQRYAAPTPSSQAQQAAPMRQEQAPQRDYASTFECRQAQRDIDIARGSVTASQSEKVTNVAAAQRKADLACLGPAGYREAEAARAEARERAKERRARAPGVITHCDPGGCNDNYGNRYHRAGPNLVSGGKTCTPAGSGWSCN